VQQGPSDITAASGAAWDGGETRDFAEDDGICWGVVDCSCVPQDL
jgi:hypothetical protein